MHIADFVSRYARGYICLQKKDRGLLLKSAEDFALRISTFPKKKRKHEGLSIDVQERPTKQIKAEKLPTLFSKGKLKK